MIQVSSGADAFLAHTHVTIYKGRAVVGHAASRENLYPATEAVIAQIRETGADQTAQAVQKAAIESSYGLAAGVITRDIRNAHLISRSLRTGVIGINRHMVADKALQFGGNKQSGWGRERRRDVLDVFIEVGSFAVAL